MPMSVLAVDYDYVLPSMPTAEGGLLVLVLVVLSDDGMAEGGMLTEGALLHDQYSSAG